MDIIFMHQLTHQKTIISEISKARCRWRKLNSWFPVEQRRVFSHIDDIYSQIREKYGDNLFLPYAAEKHLNKRLRVVTDPCIENELKLQIPKKPCTPIKVPCDQEKNCMQKDCPDSNIFFKERPTKDCLNMKVCASNINPCDTTKRKCKTVWKESKKHQKGIFSNSNNPLKTIKKREIMKHGNFAKSYGQVKEDIMCSIIKSKAYVSPTRSCCPKFGRKRKYCNSQGWCFG